jgi:hypothetical protein
MQHSLALQLKPPQQIVPGSHSSSDAQRPPAETVRFRVAPIKAPAPSPSARKSDRRETLFPISRVNSSNR